MINQKIADIFQEIGDILEIKGKDKFRIRSYHQAALTISNLSKDLEEIYKKNPKDLEKIPGIGSSLCKKIEEIIKTGKCKKHQQLIKSFDKGLLDMLRVRTIGPKKVKLFYQKIKINNITNLKKAAKEGKLRNLPGMGEKSEEEIIKALSEFEKFQKRFRQDIAENRAVEILNYLKQSKDIKKAEFAGSLRRRKETIGDLDILAVGRNTKKIMEHFIKFPDIKKIIAKGTTKASIILRQDGIQVDFRVVPASSFGAALYYFTGSKTHNIATRDITKRKGLKINEYGVFKGTKKIAGRTENEIFKSINIPYIIPEMRENEGEIEAAKARKLPKTVDFKDIKGDLHMHTDWTDGQSSLEEMIYAAKKIGYEYIAITDHYSNIGIVNSLNPHRMTSQIKKIEKIQKKVKGLKILTGVEADIRQGGNIQIPDKTAEKLDIVIASVHSLFNLSEKEQTERVIKAIKNPHVNILAHPSCRRINEREPVKIDMEKIIRACKEYKVALELNSHPIRLDLKDTHLKMAKAIGAKIVINTDSHLDEGLMNMRYGIFTAKRGWLEKKDVLNTLSLNKLLKWFAK